jgi:uncharacterized protein (TIGR02246 family)
MLTPPLQWFKLHHLSRRTTSYKTEASMQRRNAALFTWFALALAACTAPGATPSAPPVDLAAEGDAVRAISMRWLELERSKDAAGVAALFAADGIAFRAQHEPVVGNAAIQEYMAAEYAANPTSRVEWTTDRVEVAASGDLAAEYGTFSETSDSGEADNGKFVTVYRKVNGEWKVAADMSVSTKPAAPATTTTM